MEIINVTWLIPTLIMALGIGAGYAFSALLNRARSTSDVKRAHQLVDEARRQAETIRREVDLKGRESVVRAREEFERENVSRRQDLTAAEERLAAREANLDRRAAMLETKEGTLDSRLRDLEAERSALVQREKEVAQTRAEMEAKLQEIAALPREEARKILMQRMEEEARPEMGALLRRMVDETRRTAEQQAREIIASAIERYAAPQVSSITTCTVSLPNEEMKGRIIGKEGRNIRALEAETGCNILIDDTPETVVISGFDPVRRETARRLVERLVADGRIHPARIEEVGAAVREEVEDMIRQAGEQAVCDLQLTGVAPEIVRTVGMLKFRHSYSQNVLQHSVEMAHLMSMMAADLHLDPAIAKRVGLFHDLGKALDHTVEGGHAEIGANLLRRYNEPPIVINAVAAHHKETEGSSIYAILATAADAITAARPGARTETTELYLKRLEQLENVANSFRGVKQSYAIQAGRELRVIVLPSKIDDNEAMQMARNISKQIEEQIKYPGQIKVTVIRETRCVEYAR